MSAADPATRVRPLLPPSHQRFPLLDSLRALAAIAILVVHAALLTGHGFALHGLLAHLDIGVPFFFLLSAFLLYRPFVAARVLGARRRSFNTYARRRFLRVVPAYWAALTVAAIVPAMAGAFSSNWWVYYGLLQNYPVYEAKGECAVNVYRCGLPPTWSLALEVFFYATLPLFVLLTDRVARRRPGWAWRELAVIGALAAVSVWIQSSRPTTDLDRWLFYSPLGRGWWFGLGLALAVVSVMLEARRGEPRAVTWVRRHADAVAAAGVGLFLVLSLFVFGPDTTLAYPVRGQAEYIAQYLLFGVVALLLVIPAVLGHRDGGLWRRLLAHPSLAWLGLVSYGIFLWQFPVMIGLLDVGMTKSFVPFLAVAFAGTVACAALSYYLLERPLMRRGRREPEIRAEAAPAAG